MARVEPRIFVCLAFARGRLAPALPWRLGVQHGFRFRSGQRLVYCQQANKLVSLKRPLWGRSMGIGWYQSGSRVVPRPPRGRRERGFVFRTLYGAHRTSNIRHPTSNTERPGKATQSHIKATPKPVDSQVIGTPKPPKGSNKAPTKRQQSHPQTILNGLIRHELSCGRGAVIGFAGDYRLPLSDEE